MTRPNHNHQHSHGCSHSHHHDHHIGADTHEHDHAPIVTQDNEGRVFQVMLLTGIFMFIEAAGGFISGSLALLADAGHMLTDTAALALAWAAFRVARKSADHKKSYGYHRFQILAAFANGLTLLAIAVWIVAEAVTRLLHPVEVAAPSMLVVAILGLGVNIAAFWLLSKADGENLNVRGALLHVIGDLLGSVAAIAAALIIMVTGWLPIDPLLSALVAGLILRSAWRIVKDSSHILLQGVPHGAEGL